MVQLKSWIATFLMYPTLIIALFSGMPKLYEFYQSYKLGLPVSKLQIALEQRRLWEKNLTCLLKIETYQMKVADQTLIEVTLCPSGDVLFHHLQPDGASIYLWLAYDSFKKISLFPSLTSIVGAEMVFTENSVTQSTHCIRLNEEFVFWEKKYTKSCHVEKIFTYTGDSILIEKEDCEQSCQ